MGSNFEEIEQFYQQMWGDRWPPLREALLAPELQVARRNLFSDWNARRSDGNDVPAWSSKLPNCYDLEALGQTETGQIPRGSEGLLGYFVLDPISVVIANSLEVQCGDRVLDMCSAPGGKALVLIECMGTGGEVVLNDVSANRRERLKKVIQQYVPREVRSRVRISGVDGGRFAKSHPQYFSKVLVDAPCSGESHLLRSPKSRGEWNSKMTLRLAQRQYALLTGALEAVQPGGQIVYSTCSISKFENDEVIRRLLSKKKGRIQIKKIESFIGEATEFGWQCLPDRGGVGPFYWCALERSSA